KLDKIYKLLKHPAIFDGRNVFSVEKMEELGFYYESMGRKVIHSNITFTGKNEESPIREREITD
ncbi:MAG: hypothetical protein EBZ77_15395, partial [Chitinophagia bacterium]|nr:hypothetical protein [Chitinophagia bacterium]